MHPEDRLKELGLSLPGAAAPIANFVNYRIVGDMLYLSGQGPREADGTLRTGRLGESATIEDGYRDARLVCLNLIAVAKSALGDLDRIAGWVKLLGMVNATPAFSDHPKVINGCSDLLVEIFGDRGRHARSAVGFSSLPGGITVEIEAILQIKE
jgi:enamine deaminase RidA (YjgF/YER057c/UK114 family)